jgi:hypothetical protein
VTCTYHFGESTFVEIFCFRDSQGKSMRGRQSNSRSRELRKVLVLRLGCGHIGKGAEEEAYALSCSQFPV